MTLGEQQSALEGLVSSAGWQLVRERLEEMAAADTTRLLKVTPEDAAHAPLWAARAKTAQDIAAWPSERIETLKMERRKRREEQGDG